MIAERSPSNMETRALDRHAWRRVCLLLACLIALCFQYAVNGSALGGAWAPAEIPPDDSRVGAVCLYNTDSRQMLHEKNADAVIYPAASVKIMTGLLACRSLEDRLEETVELTSAMLAGASGRNMGLVPEEQVKIYDLLASMICGGYNDAACVLAYLCAGSVDAFPEQMNNEALRLGAVHTTYKNPTGLHDPEMVTTARDTLLIAHEAMQNELYMSLVSLHNYTVPATNASGERSFSNRNLLTSDTGGQYYNGRCRGMNAGMTDEGGWCVITLWEHDGASNLCVVMNASDVPTGEAIPAYTYTNRLLSWAGRCYTYQTVLSSEDPLETLPVKKTGTSKSETGIYVPEDLRVYLPAHINAQTDIALQYHLDGDELTAPLAQGQTVGTLTVIYDGAVVASSPIIVREAFARNSFLNLLDHMKAYFMSRAFGVTVVVFLILLIFYLKYSRGPGGRYTTKQTYVPSRKKNKKYRALKKSRRI